MQLESESPNDGREFLATGWCGQEVEVTSWRSFHNGKVLEEAHDGREPAEVVLDKVLGGVVRRGMAHSKFLRSKVTLCTAD